MSLAQEVTRGGLVAVRGGFGAEVEAGSFQVHRHIEAFGIIAQIPVTDWPGPACSDAGAAMGPSRVIGHLRRVERRREEQHNG